MATSSEICLVCTMGAEVDNPPVGGFDGCDHKFHQGCIDAAREQFIEGCPRCHEVKNSALPSPSPPASLAQYEDAQVAETVPAETSLGSPRQAEVAEGEVAETRTTESKEEPQVAEGESKPEDAPRMTEEEPKSEPRITEAKEGEKKGAEAPEAGGGKLCVCGCASWAWWVWWVDGVRWAGVRCRVRWWQGCWEGSGGRVGRQGCVLVG